MNAEQIQKVAARYDRALQYAHDARLPANAPRPQPTRAWPPENLELLARYYAWLRSGGLSEPVIETLDLPTAGHVLGLNLKPHSQLDLEADLLRALDYLRAKQVSAEWAAMSRHALNKFRTFLQQQRGIVEVKLQTPNLARYQEGLPDWLVTELTRYQHVMQNHWRPARLEAQTRRFWGGHTRLWRWLCAHYTLNSISDIKRRYLLAYVDHKLVAGYAASSINSDLRCFVGLLRFLQENDYAVPQALFRMPSLKQPEALPRFLTDEQVLQLRAEFETCVTQAPTFYERRIALLDRAAFYLLWQAGLRLGEVEELCVDDLDLAGRKLLVRQGKGQKDRTVYLTDTVVRTLQEYLAVRGQGATNHVFLYRHRPVQKDLLSCHIRYAGQRAGVKVSAHCLRHTCATQLLNAGCRITSIQKLLGHRRIDTTLIYARVHDRTVAEDYYTAMAHIEKGLNLTGKVENSTPSSSVHSPEQLLELVNQLAEPQLDVETRLKLVEQMRQMLDGGISEQMAVTAATHL